MGGSGRQPSDDHRRRDRDRRSSSAGRDSKHSVWKGGRDRKRSRSPERRRRGSEDRSRSRRRGERDRLDAGGRAAGRDSRGRSGGKERRSRDDGWERARKASSEGGGASARQDDPTSKRARVGHQSASPRSGEGRSARHPVPTRLLSFGDEVEEGSDTDDFSLARSTAHRFAHERTLVLSTPLDYENQGPQLSMKDVSISRESDVMGNVKPSLSAIYLGAHQSRGLRPYMEDRCCLVPNFTPMSRGAPVADGVSRCFVGIYDGHNGVMSADMAAARLHRMLADDPVIRMHTGEGPPAIVRAEEEQITEALKKAFRTLDDEILGESRQEETQDGATALMALTVGEALYMAHAGECRWRLL
ncbi:unnamed protein product [Ostreobium quekettii]|uniref:PPM-type phosphatase domain-containing protein n=1 Tax=Ostreobium quekettii TaxID=121088 RepID=A0A8S1JE54_9CHLO|nr:unnamed protein product [Ostreobium quekettii]|eukprot:evm.model.scf_144.10 EVM.evm.TU.scf_144.10   scf_144:110345-114247(+)